ncbi:MAG: TIGR00730 family Rossman fold protein [Alphaproteobacteria bacterium]|nr:TIGR00730 family Rossman fold protein [Alphaproteobacteria bacterium]
MKKLEKICVFCGSKSGKDPVYTQAAFQLGTILAQNNIQLIYGAGGTGVMHAVADGCKQAGGQVLGVTIDRLFKIEKPDLSDEDEVQVFHHMFTRKVAMTKMADAFVVLPGGLGTMDELFELMTLKQLGVVQSPLIVLNINFFFDGLRAFIHQFIRDGFVNMAHEDLVQFVENVEDILPTIEKQFQKTQGEEQS